jgi:hypothetical protein
MGRNLHWSIILAALFLFFWTIEHRVGRPADGPVRLGLAQVIPPPAKSLGLGLIRHAVRLTASKDDVRRGSHMSSVRDRINATINRADDLLRERLRREPLEREDAERADAAREQARADSWRCREIAELYDDSFRSFGVSTPSP